MEMIDDCSALFRVFSYVLKHVWMGPLMTKWTPCSSLMKPTAHPWSMSVSPLKDQKEQLHRTATTQ